MMIKKIAVFLICILFSSICYSGGIPNISETKYFRAEILKKENVTVYGVKKYIIVYKLKSKKCFKHVDFETHYAVVNNSGIKVIRIFKHDKIYNLRKDQEVKLITVHPYGFEKTFLIWRFNIKDKEDCKEELVKWVN